MPSGSLKEERDGHVIWTGSVASLTKTSKFMHLLKSIICVTINSKKNYLTAKLN